ncbi:hypothetical protein Ae505Ps2_3539 [Pseudonocardia sp. Ae505_Ps2]|nr:hypothetical protein Ae331Ps2_4367 [Pseudonocardia sp. Ae331_Ps2]OLM13411.1 hypothetical protein Ae505Ps2_3539 [Pseudonocardia sp. Ae505_Ps2]
MGCPVRRKSGRPRAHDRGPCQAMIDQFLRDGWVHLPGGAGPC